MHNRQNNCQKHQQVAPMRIVGISSVTVPIAFHLNSRSSQSQCGVLKFCSLRTIIQITRHFTFSAHFPCACEVISFLCITPVFQSDKMASRLQPRQPLKKSSCRPPFEFALSPSSVYVLRKRIVRNFCREFGAIRNHLRVKCNRSKQCSQ